jgi:bifunctional DNA-binding transcriptional regulator/antitoxin component of YhaV-PrlF toxin-antitoxin module
MGKTASHLVGLKGQVVIEKETRDRLGVKPGWRALQLLVGDHVEIYLVPPEHKRSLAGSLSRYAKLADSESLDEARDKAWAEAARQRVQSDE